MNQITDIYKLAYMNGSFSYVGTLRNEKCFNIHDKVYFIYEGNKISYGVICGVELPPKQNPDYIYKIQVSDWLFHNTVEEDVKEFIYSEKEGKLKNVTLKCDKIFSTIEEAKQSAIKNLELHYKLEGELIERYFNQFK
jgi:hypothetical protein